MRPFILCLCMFLTLSAESGLVNDQTANKSKDSCMRDNKTLEIERSIKLADEMIRDGDYQSADKLSKRTLELLGSEYYSQGTIDDTGMGLIAAQIQEDKGEFKSASLIRLKILKERYEMFKNKGR